MRKNIYTLLLLSFIMISCTENPFSVDKYNQLEKEKISGKVLLQDGVAPDGIFIWIDGLNIHTATDEDGKFSLSIPLPENQSGGNGLNGIFSLYMFMGNYQADSVSIEFTEGHLLDDQDNISNKGKLRETVELKQLVNCDSFLSNEGFTVIEFDTTELLQRFIFDINASSKTQVIYSMREDFEGDNPGFYRTGVIFEPMETGHKPVISKRSKAELYSDAIPLNYTKSFNFDMELQRDNFEEIDYWVYPFMFMDHPQLPERFFDALGREKMVCDENYLQYPFKRSPIRVRIVKN